MNEAAVAMLVPGLAATGAGLGRWTRRHPLAIGGTVGLPVMLPALSLAGAMMSEVVLLVAVLAGFVASGPAAFGAYLGQLRRQHKERIG